MATFPFDSKNVAGCKVLSGIITKSSKLVIVSGEKEKGEVKITSLKRGRQNIDEAKPGEECGIVFEPQLDFSIGDMLLSVRK